MVESANQQNPFKVIYANHSLANDLSVDEHEIVKVLDFKNLMNEYLRPNLDYLSEVRIIEFTNQNTKISLDLRKKPDIELNLLKNEISLIGITQLYTNLNNAYKDFLPIKQEKYNDIRKLLTYAHLPENTTFYSNKYLKVKGKFNIEIFRNAELLNHCKCKGKCIKNCICKLNNKLCTNLCSCNSQKCNNKSI
jgi:hypothetical protein